MSGRNSEYEECQQLVSRRYIQYILFQSVYHRITKYGNADQSPGVKLRAIHQLNDFFENRLSVEKQFPHSGEMPVNAKLPHIEKLAFVYTGYSIDLYFTYLESCKITIFLTFLLIWLILVLLTSFAQYSAKKKEHIKIVACSVIGYIVSIL